MTPTADHGRTRLNSWKEIAAHLERDVRTAVRWEQERGLPVHRVPGGRYRTVFAYVDELEAWLASQPSSPLPTAAPASREETPLPVPSPAAAAPRMPASVAVLLITIVVTVLLAWRWWPATVVPQAIGSVIPDAHALTALSPDGRVVWRYVPNVSVIDPSRGGRLWHSVRDLDGAPGDEVMVAGTSSSEEPEALLSFTNAGALRWVRALDDRLTFGADTFGPPWRTTDLTTFTHDGAPRIVWAVHHQMWFPSIVAMFDGAGRLLQRFVHPGWLTTVRATPDGRYVLAAGVNNELKAHVVAMLDARSLGGATPGQTPPYRCSNCPQGAAFRYVVLPRTELARRADLPLLNNKQAPKLFVLPTGAIELHIVDELGEFPAADTIFEWRPDLTFAGARVSESYWAWHRRLEKSGAIDHDEWHCPDRQALTVRELTP